MWWWWWGPPAWMALGALGSPLSLDAVADKLAFLKDYFMVHLYVNPHPLCALRAEPCTLDNNCCGGLECRMKAGPGGGGIGSVCMAKIGGGGGEDADADPDTEEVGWKIGAMGTNEDGWESGSTAGEAHRERARQAWRRQEVLADVTGELIRELSPDEMVSERRRQEADELRRDEELRELTRWKEDKDERDREKEREAERIEALARDRVDRVLQEEDKQKMDMLHRMQAAIKTENDDDKQ